MTTSIEPEPLKDFEQFWQKFRDNHANKVKDLTNSESEVMFLIRCAIRDRDREYQARAQWLKEECDFIDPDAEGTWSKVIDRAFPYIIDTDSPSTKEMEDNKK